MDAHIKKLAEDAGFEFESADQISADLPADLESASAWDYQLEAFARAIAEDCAKICRDLNNSGARVSAP